MSEEITAIPTRYKGHHFRSRLEARWAIFFDAIGLEWEYEPEGLQLPEGVKYLPDFVLNLRPGALLVEVKHGDVVLGDDELKKPLLAADSGRSVLLLTGPPDERRMWDICIGNKKIILCMFRDYGNRLVFADSYWFSVMRFDKATGRSFLTHDDRGIEKAFGKGLAKAVEAARSARFEHGQSGAT